MPSKLLQPRVGMELQKYKNKIQNTGKGGYSLFPSKLLLNMKKTIFFIPFLYLIFGITLFSCTTDEDILNIENNNPTFDNDDYQEIDFIMSANKTNTRCTYWGVSDNNKNIFDDECVTSDAPLNFILVLAINKELIFTQLLDTIKYSGSGYEILIPDYSKNPYVTNIKIPEKNKISFTLRFLKFINPSEIELFCFASENRMILNNSYGLKTDDYENLKYKTSDSSNCCLFYKKHNLTNTNSWENIDTTIKLKRKQSEIYVLFQNEDYGINKLNRTTDHIQYEFIATALNHTTSIENCLYIKKNLTMGVIGRVDSSDQTLWPVNDKICIHTEDINMAAYSSVWPFETGQLYGYTKGNNSLVYNDKNYYFLFPLSFLSSESKTIPKNENDENIKYITLIFFQQFYWPASIEHKQNFYWTNIPIPEGGFESNKRYVIILREDYPLWDNSIINYTTTRTQTPATFLSEPIVSSADYELLEFDMDEQLPFILLDEDSHI